MLVYATQIHVVVMGVSGSGKSTIAEALGHRLGAEVIEGDEHHPPENVAKMAAGIPLTDEDRDPWLDRLSAAISGADAEGRSTVTACSALRRAYRARLLAAVPRGRMRFVELDVDAGTLRRRMEGRDYHFMPPTLLASQLASLEPLEPDEPGLRVDASRSVEEVVTSAARGLTDVGSRAPRSSS